MPSIQALVPFAAKPTRAAGLELAPSGLLLSPLLLSSSSFASNPIPLLHPRTLLHQTALRSGHFFAHSSPRKPPIGIGPGCPGHTSPFPSKRPRRRKLYFCPSSTLVPLVGPGVGASLSTFRPSICAVPGTEPIRCHLHIFFLLPRPTIRPRPASFFPRVQSTLKAWEKTHINVRTVLLVATPPTQGRCKAGRNERRACIQLAFVATTCCVKARCWPGLA